MKGAGQIRQQWGNSTRFSRVNQPRKSTIERTFVAPFARANREENYQMAWQFFNQSL